MSIWIRLGVQCDTTNYIIGVQYRGSQLDFAPHAEGRVVRNAQTGTWQYEYHLKDHLGNLRVAFADVNNDGQATLVDVKQTHAYYPFGMVAAGMSSPVSGEQYKYQYNGKELQTHGGLNWLDYGFRFYDPTIARFVAHDPLAHDFVYLTPYQYASNNPIRNIDLDGLEGFSKIEQTREVIQKEEYSVTLGFQGTINLGIAQIDVNFGSITLLSRSKESNAETGKSTTTTSGVLSNNNDSETSSSFSIGSSLFGVFGLGTYGLKNKEVTKPSGATIVEQSDETSSIVPTGFSDLKAESSNLGGGLNSFEKRTITTNGQDQSESQTVENGQKTEFGIGLGIFFKTSSSTFVRETQKINHKPNQK